MDENLTPESEPMADMAPDATASAAPAAPEFGQIDDAADVVDPAALSVLYDLALPVTIELGRSRMAVQDLLKLGRGSVIQLDRLAGEPIDVFIGDRRFAEGEVVVVGEHFAVRITRIIASATPAPASVEAMA